MKLKKTMLLTMLLAISLILSYVEAILPHFLPLPGMKIGLSNMVILFTLLTIGKKEAFLISIMRLLSVALLFGTLLTPGFLIGVGGAFFAWLAMALGEKTPLSILGISILGASMHNLGQITVAFLLLDTLGVFYLLPFLLLGGLVFGIVTGLPVSLLIRHAPLQTLFKNIGNE